MRLLVALKCIGRTCSFEKIAPGKLLPGVRVLGSGPSEGAGCRQALVESPGSTITRGGSEGGRAGVTRSWPAVNQRQRRSSFRTAVIWDTVSSDSKSSISRCWVSLGLRTFPWQGLSLEPQASGWGRSWSLRACVGHTEQAASDNGGSGFTLCVPLTGVSHRVRLLCITLPPDNLPQLKHLLLSSADVSLWRHAVLSVRRGCSQAHSRDL